MLETQEAVVCLFFSLLMCFRLIKIMDVWEADCGSNGITCLDFLISILLNQNSE